MRLIDLIEQLQDLAAEHGDDIEVRLAVQPSWPFEHSIAEVVAVSEADGDEDDFCEACQQHRPCSCDDREAAEPVVIYIGEGGQLGYLGGLASKALGWGRR